MKTGFIFLLFATIIPILISCGGDSGNSQDEILAEISAKLEVVNNSESNLSFINISILPHTDDIDYSNEIDGEPIATNGRRTYDLTCIGIEIQYIRVGWEGGFFKDYSLSAPCGFIYTVEVP